MKFSSTFFAAIIAANVSVAQDSHYMDGNNVAASVSNTGVFFNDPLTSAAGYEFPKFSGNHLMYAMGFWYGGPDINGNLKMAMQTYTPNGDMWTGPLTTGGAADYPASSEEYGVYPVTKSEIDNHIENYETPGYIVPENLENWPAHGDIADGVDYYLAPFEDVNGNGVYEPESGDYPKIKGDLATYIIMNDKGGVHESGGDPIGIEVHYLVYQYATLDDLNNTVFLNMKIINRGTQTIYDFRTGCWLDSDLGFAGDDYVGYDPDSKMMYSYNGSAYDAGGAGMPGYGDNPPAFGVTCLNAEPRAFATYGATGPTAPETIAHFYNLMGAIWPSGVHFTEGGTGYGGEEPTDFLYSGNPNTDGEWSELGEGNPPGDRRMLMSVEDEMFVPNEILCYDFAIVTGWGEGYVENVNTLIENAELTKTFYDNETAYCMSGVLSAEELNKPAKVLSVYPNPNAGVFTVEAEGTYKVEIFSLDGRLIHQDNGYNTTVVNADLTPGTYVLVLEQNGKRQVSKLVVKK